jgi:putative tricarboxylic transport membrane protein
MEIPMPDRIFAACLFVVTLFYGVIALFFLKAPFQYDPLGPESWPRILAAVMLVCLVLLFRRPDKGDFVVSRATWIHLVAILALLIAYALLFEPFGFIIATALFAAIASRMLGAPWMHAALFGVGMGVGGYLLCAGLLGLNLPAGPLPRI